MVSVKDIAVNVRTLRKMDLESQLPLDEISSSLMAPCWCSTLNINALSHSNSSQHPKQPLLRISDQRFKQTIDKHYKIGPDF